MIDNSMFNTSQFSLSKEDLKQLDDDTRRQEYVKQLHYVFEALKEKGYDPVAQLMGYILSEDPTYITAHKNARIIAQRMDRDEILKMLLENFLNQ